jgi:hypothetical protein
MARRGSTKDRSEQHENWIAAEYDGVRSPSSGAADTDQGDVRTKTMLIECKTTGTPEKPSRLPVFIQHLEKVCQEAWEEGRDGMVALRYYYPESRLANNDGWVDVVVRQEMTDTALCRDWEDRLARDRESEENFLNGLKEAGI